MIIDRKRLSYWLACGVVLAQLTACTGEQTETKSPSSGSSGTPVVSEADKSTGAPEVGKVSADTKATGSSGKSTVDTGADRQTSTSSLAGSKNSTGSRVAVYGASSTQTSTENVSGNPVSGSVADSPKVAQGSVGSSLSDGKGKENCGDVIGAALCYSGNYQLKVETDDTE